MTPERWQEVEELYQAVQDRGRQAMADAGPELRREVESLLAKDSVPELPAFRPGAKMGPYEIVARIGAGGMGEVWKARDTRLGRSVAIKTSRARFGDRFAREARAVAALNHPHICTLHDVGPDYLVMELVEGVPLKGPLSVERALPLAIELAGALDAAHRNGIVHRDLKPGNILLTKRGVKVLDFGLATMDKRHDFPPAEECVSRVTRQGEVIGTLQYMAPEQLNGKRADARSDIFAFGCVLYELITGKAAFGGQSAASVVAAVLERPAPTLALAGAAPATLDWALKLCLAKDPDERWQSARDLQACLERIATVGEVVPRVKSRGTRLWQGGAALLAAAAMMLAVIHFRESVSEAPVIRSVILPPPNTFPGDVALSPDGRLIVFRSISDDKRSRLYVRPLASSLSEVLEGTIDAVHPFWSPDSKSVAFGSQDKLMRIPVAGGAPTPIAHIRGPIHSASWTSNGTILVSVANHLLKIPSSGGAATDILGPDGQAAYVYSSACLLPDGRHFVYSLYGASEQELRPGSLDPTENSRLASQTLGPGGADLMYSQGYLLMRRSGNLIALPFDAKRLAVTGEAKVVARLWGSPDLLNHPFAAAAGMLVYRPGGASRGLAWFDRAGHRLGLVGNPGDKWQHLSHNGRQVAVAAEVGGNRDLWIIDLERGIRSRFTTNPGGENDAVWSPDDSEIIFSSARGGPYNIYRKAVNGTGAEELLYADPFRKLPLSWSPDGKHLLFGWVGLDRGEDIFTLPLTGDRKPVAFATTEFNERHPQFSPDGKWVAYQSDESGHYEVYVAPFPVAPGRVQVSVGGGTHPRWRADGREVFYVDPARTLVAADIALTPRGARVGAMKPLFGPMDEAQGGWPYDVSPDGKRILALSPVGLNEPMEPLTLVQNWTAGLGK
jgi:serine/threonine protein kinase